MHTMRRMLYILLVLVLDWTLNQATNTSDTSTTSTTKPTTSTDVSSSSTSTPRNFTETSTSTTRTDTSTNVSSTTASIIKTSATSTTKTTSMTTKGTFDGSSTITSTNSSTDISKSSDLLVFTVLVVVPIGVAVIGFCITYAKRSYSDRDDDRKQQNKNGQDGRSDEDIGKEDDRDKITDNDDRSQQHKNNQDGRRDEGSWQENDDRSPSNPEQHHELLQVTDERRNIADSNGDIFPKTRIQEGFVPNNPRHFQIIIMPVEQMRDYIGKPIGEGGFGKVYKDTERRKMQVCDKKIEITEELFQKSYEKEIDNGRILHPFINPIIARAESRPTMSEKGISYIMYPYMKNKDLRRNIDRVNRGKKLSPNESNADIWSRCIYQIAQAMDFIHKPASAVRGPIFHRDLTSRNILLDENFNVRIGDFGIAVEAEWNTSHVTRSAGTEGYYPPSMKNYKYTASYDIFTVGVVMLEILTGLEAQLKESPHCLYKKYNSKRGYEYLKEDLDVRAEENEAASWNKKDRRDMLAKIALKAVHFDGSRRMKINLLEKLKDMRLDLRERYRKPENLDRCVSCCVNPIANLSTKGTDCIRNEGKDPCQYFCIHCLTNHHFNPLVCPQHGRTRPPFGDYVYGVFVAGNGDDNAQQLPGMQGPNHDTAHDARMFKRDVQKVFRVLTATHPLVLGASKENLRVVRPNKLRIKDKMEPNIKKAFEELSDIIKQAIREKNLDPAKDRLPNSLFIFYFSGHCSTDKGLHLGSTEDTLKASTIWIQEMLHMELGVELIVIVLDCCHANSQNFIHTQGSKAPLNSEYSRKKATIVQLSSCDVDEKSRGRLEGSFFTHFFSHGLLGLDSEGDMIKFCDECEKLRTNKHVIDSTLPCGKYHNQCLSDNGVTIYALKDFIQGHFHLRRANASNPGIMTLVHNAQGEKEVFLAYYNPYKRHIPIHLKGSDAPRSFSLCSNPGSMDKLREDIFRYIVETKSHPEWLNLKQYLGPDSRHLIAIHQRYGTDRNKELTSLDSIYKARFCGRELEAQVREKINGLSNGPVKLSKINDTFVTKSETTFIEDYLKIYQRYILIPIKSIERAEEQLKKMKLASSNYPEGLKAQIHEVLQIIRNIHTVDEGSLLQSNLDKELKFRLYKDFSVLKIE